MNTVPALLTRARRPLRLGLVAGGLGAYWPQFPDLLSQLRSCAKEVQERLRGEDVEIVDAGFISDEREAARATETLRRADLDLLVLYLPTYVTSSMVLPIAQRSGAPILVLSLQPGERMDHATFDTGQWLAYCGQCPVPEVGNVFRRAGVPFRSVTGWLGQDVAWHRVERWIAGARVRAALRDGRHGTMGHLYPGMLDVSTDLTQVATTFGSHVEVLEMDDLRVRVEDVTDAQTKDRVELARDAFAVQDTVQQDDLTWAARISVALDQLVSDFDLDTLAYYHRGLRGEQHERLGAGMILGASLLTTRGVPTTGEFELRTTLAQLVTQSLGGAGSFTEIQALDFVDGVVEMGHDGPAHLAMAADQPTLRGLGVYHGKRGWGVSVEINVRPGPVTLLGVGQDADGSYTFIASEGTVVDGPHLQIGNTTSRVDFERGPGEWVDAWSATGVGHHWSLALGHRAADIAAAGDLLGLQTRLI